MARGGSFGTNPLPPFSANIFEPVPAGAILTSLHPVGNLSQRMYGSIRIRYVTQLSAGTPLFQGAKCVPTSTMNSDLAGGRKYQNGTCFAPWNNGVPAAAKCAKKIISGMDIIFFAKMGGPLGGGRGLVTGVIVKLLVAAKVDLEMVPSA